MLPEKFSNYAILNSILTKLDTIYKICKEPYDKSKNLSMQLISNPNKTKTQKNNGYNLTEILVRQYYQKPRPPEKYRKDTRKIP